MRKNYTARGRERTFDDELNKKIAEELVSKRKALGLTQEEVAKKMGIAQSTVAHIETAADNLTLTKLVRYLEALGVREMNLPIKDGQSIYYQT